MNISSSYPQHYLHYFFACFVRYHSCSGRDYYKHWIRILFQCNYREPVFYYDTPFCRELKGISLKVVRFYVLLIEKLWNFSLQLWYSIFCLSTYEIIRPSLMHNLLSLVYCDSHTLTAALYTSSTDTWKESREVMPERNLTSEGANHETKGSEIKFSECIWLGAPGINLDADTSFSTTSHQNEEKLPRHDQAESGTPRPSPCRTVSVLLCVTWSDRVRSWWDSYTRRKTDIPRNRNRQME